MAGQSPQVKTQLSAGLSHRLTSGGEAVAVVE